MHRASPALRMLPSSTITVGTSAALSVPRSRRTSSPSPPYAVETPKPAPTRPARTRSASARDRPEDVVGPAGPLARADHEEAVRRGGGAVAVQRDLEVGADLRAEPAAGADARPPVVDAVGGAGQPDGRAERLEPALQRPRHPPGEGGLGEAAVGRRAGRVARLPQPDPDQPVDLARCRPLPSWWPGSMAIVRPASGSGSAGGGRGRARPRSSVGTASRTAASDSGADLTRQPVTPSGPVDGLSVLCGMLAGMPAPPPTEVVLEVVDRRRPSPPPSTGRAGAGAGGRPEAALEALADYAERYAVVARLARVRFSVAAGDDAHRRRAAARRRDHHLRRARRSSPRPTAATLTAAEADRQVRLLRAGWQELDRLAVEAPEQLRKGPRGGGRDRDKVVAHVIEAERSYARTIGVRHPPFHGDPARAGGLPGRGRAGAARGAHRRADAEVAGPLLPAPGGLARPRPRLGDRGQVRAGLNRAARRRGRG